MRAIVTGGGSGGHIYPAIAIADKIMEMDPESEILYIGNDIGIEKDLVPKQTNYRFEMVEARWFSKGISEIIKTGIATLKGKRQALKLMKEFKPDVVIGTGGFVCVPVILAGKSYGAKCYLHEQNAFPGVANRFLEKYVDNIFLGFDLASKFFKQPEKHIFVGNPVRECFYDLDRSVSRKNIDVPDDIFTIFVFAGSQGSDKITEIMLDMISKINGIRDVMLLWATGPLHYRETLDALSKEGIEIKDNIRIESYIENMQDYIGASDLIISRSGALSVAEISVSGRASILIPSPNVTGNHQFYNAKAITDKGGAILMEEKDMSTIKLLTIVRELKNDSAYLDKMEKLAHEATPDNATDRIYSILSK